MLLGQFGQLYSYRLDCVGQGIRSLLRFLILLHFLLYFEVGRRSRVGALEGTIYFKI